MLKRYMSYLNVALFLILGLTITANDPANASTYSASVDTPVIPGRPYGITVEDEIPVTASNQLVGAHTWFATATTGAGTVGAIADASSNGDGTERWEAALASNALILDDLIFTSPNSDPINATLYLHLSGTFSRTLDSARETCVNKLSVRVNFHGTQANGEYNVTESFDSAGVHSKTESPSGILSDQTGDSVSKTIVVTATGIPVNTPVGLSLRLVAQAVASRFTCRTITDLSHTFSFPTSGPVFDLPSGVTVNSIKGNIVNNVFGGSPVATESSSWSAVKAMFR